MSVQKKFFEDVLAETIASLLAEPREPAASLPLASHADKPDPIVKATEIAKELIREVMAKGLPVVELDVNGERLSGGNTADVVARFKFEAPFVFKSDKKPKLIHEAKVMQTIKGNERLDKRYRDAWPMIHAIRQTEPYAYIMEYFPTDDGWISLEDRFYPEAGQRVKGEPDELIHAALELMFLGFETSIEKRAVSNLVVDYVGRIEERLVEVAEKDPRFKSQWLEINGRTCAPWQTYLEIIRKNMDKLSQIAAPFMTVVHGDPNPGNILLRVNNGAKELKFIDPKDWGTGDYLFDITKLTHFIACTGPIEKPTDGLPFEVDYQETGDGRASLSYEIRREPWTAGVIEACRQATSEFATRHGDIHWEARYELGMASNLLGLPLGRLDKDPPREAAALALFGEGMEWLARFCSRLQEDHTNPGPAIEINNACDIEPSTLQTFRNTVRSNVPSIEERFDRRGFQLLHWPPARTNSNGKPAELSLEHEARFRATSDTGLAELRASLRQNNGERLANLLPDSRFSDLQIERFDRSPGPQSVDLYYDNVKAGMERGLIAAGFTLRQRIMTSKFMTWGSQNEKELRPLNLELPAVSYFQSGVIARLEFNWIDDLGMCATEYENAIGNNPEDFANPLYLASLTGIFPKPPFKPVISHTAIREKFSLTSLSQPEEEQFHINIDDITAQSLATGQVVHYTDIDIAPARAVNDEVLRELIALSANLSRKYQLEAITSTKAWSDAAALNLLGTNG